jgi:integrase
VADGGENLPSNKPLATQCVNVWKSAGLPLSAFVVAMGIAPIDVARLVKRLTLAAGIEGDFAAHSLRAWFITSAAATMGVSEADIQRVSGHRSVAILRGYVRLANVFDDAPLSAIMDR